MGAGADLPGAPLLFHQIVAEQAARTPDAVAVEHGDRTLSYAELDKAARELADHLRDLDV